GLAGVGIVSIVTTKVVLVQYLIHGLTTETTEWTVVQHICGVLCHISAVVTDFFVDGQIVDFRHFLFFYVLKGLRTNPTLAAGMTKRDYTNPFTPTIS